MERYSISMYPQINCLFNTISTKISRWHYAEFDKRILKSKLEKKNQKTLNRQNKLKNRTKLEDSCLPISILTTKLQKSRQSGTGIRTDRKSKDSLKSPKINLHIMAN